MIIDYITKHSKQNWNEYYILQYCLSKIHLNQHKIIKVIYTPQESTPNFSNNLLFIIHLLINK